MKRFLHGFYEDWALAPIAGTFIIICSLNCLYNIFFGSFTHAMLWLILGHLYSDRRERYIEKYNLRENPDND